MTPGCDNSGWWLLAVTAGTVLVMGLVMFYTRGDRRGWTEAARRKWEYDKRGICIEHKQFKSESRTSMLWRAGWCVKLCPVCAAAFDAKEKARVEALMR